MNSQDVIAYFNDFAESITPPRVVVFDNASTHRSAAFLAKIDEWRERDLDLFFFPLYSPELNKIEILWRKNEI